MAPSCLLPVSLLFIEPSSPERVPASRIEASGCCMTGMLTWTRACRTASFAPRPPSLYGVTLTTSAVFPSPMFLPWGREPSSVAFLRQQGSERDFSETVRGLSPRADQAQSCAVRYDGRDADCQSFYPFSEVFSLCRHGAYRFA